jgi:hypothetical protein
MNVTTYEANRILKQLFGAVNYVAPGSWWLGLSTKAIGIDGVIPADGEPTTTAGYGRAEVTNNGTSFDTTATSLPTLISTSFGASSGDWGTIVSIFLADASTSGHVCYYYTASPSFPVLSGTTVTFDAGDIVMGMP